jgi:hypothetical protein
VTGVGTFAKDGAYASAARSVAICAIEVFEQIATRISPPSADEPATAIATPTVVTSLFPPGKRDGEDDNHATDDFLLAEVESHQDQAVVD